jgi:ribulose-5-phosphate 4-epimerase/fuculose-1-phosphate aldolase
MKEQGIQELIQISHYAAADIAYIQGGGGNTSVKLDEHRMAVKASGCKLSDMGETEGYVVVDYKLIKDYFNDANPDNAQFEIESAQVLKDAIVTIEGLKELRPSVEAGFHSVLKKYVIHTHSVYANILCCSAEGKGIAKKLFVDTSYLWLSYVNPGAVLTSVIAKEIQKLGKVPDVIFMENHGVIVTAQTSPVAIELHEMVNNKIKEYLNITEPFPEVSLEVNNEQQVVSHSSYISDYFVGHAQSLEFIREKVLYPDQLVYLNNSVYKKDGSASNIIFKNNKVAYITSLKQARVNEETLIAYLYVLNLIEEKQLTLVSMTHEQQAFILGWESEAYRKSMLK